MSPDVRFEQVAEFEPAKFDGLYYDEGLRNEVTYFYRLICVGSKGETSAPSRVFSGTPREDPFPPIGRVIIANDRPYVPSRSVQLQLTADEDTEAMMVSNLASFEGAGWQQFAPTLDWALDPNADGYAQVFAKFMDKAGNESIQYYDDVIVRSGRTLGAIRGADHPADLAAAGRGRGGEQCRRLRFGRAASPDIPPAFTDAQGNFVLPDLPPGEYELTFQREGFATETTTTKVTGGQTTDLGTGEMIELRKTYLPLLRRQ